MTLFTSKSFVCFLLLATWTLSQAKPPKSGELLCADTYPIPPEICSAIYAPVCASYPIECFTTPCPQVQTFSSACTACGDPNVKSYTPGECPAEDEEEEEEEAEWDNEQLCADTYPIPPEICPAIYTPVCASYPIECFTTPCPQVKTFSSACNACGDPNVKSYTPGECPAEGEEEEENYLDNEENCWLSEEENCWLSEEEYALGWDDETETDDDGKIECNANPDILVMCVATYDPVCGYFDDNDEENAGTTYSNDCTACYGGRVDYYVKGACPGDAGEIQIV